MTLKYVDGWGNLTSKIRSATDKRAYSAEKDYLLQKFMDDELNFIYFLFHFIYQTFTFVLLDHLKTEVLIAYNIF